MNALNRIICIAAVVTGLTGTAHAARHYFYAACNHESHGYAGFSGPRHSDAADAVKDCDAHLKLYPRHRCTVQPIVY